jgi:hypothetical protein
MWALFSQTDKRFNKHRYGDVYCIAASPSFRSRACCWRYEDFPVHRVNG